MLQSSRQRRRWTRGTVTQTPRKTTRNGSPSRTCRNIYASAPSSLSESLCFRCNLHLQHIFNQTQQCNGLDSLAIIIMCQVKYQSCSLLCNFPRMSKQHIMLSHHVTSHCLRQTRTLKTSVRFLFNQGLSMYYVIWDGGGLPN